MTTITNMKNASMHMDACVKELKDAHSCVCADAANCAEILLLDLLTDAKKVRDRMNRVMEAMKE
jgi:hypothetical protein